MLAFRQNILAIRVVPRFVLAPLVILAVCVVGGVAAAQEPNSFSSESCDAIDSDERLGIEQAQPTADELSAMSARERSIWSQTVDDLPRFKPLLKSICELSRAKAFPGIGMIEGRGEFWVARARDEGWLDEEFAPATAERRCARLWFMVLKLEGRDEARYFFCDEEGGFALISGYEKHGGAWVRLD